MNKNRILSLFCFVLFCFLFLKLKFEFFFSKMINSGVCSMCVFEQVMLIEKWKIKAGNKIKNQNIFFEYEIDDHISRDFTFCFWIFLIHCTIIIDYRLIFIDFIRLIFDFQDVIEYSSEGQGLIFFF